MEQSVLNSTSVLNSVLLVQATSAALLFLVFHYLYAEVRERYFFAWQIGWGLLTVHSLCQLLINHQTGREFFIIMCAKMALALAAMSIYISTRWVQQDFVWHRLDAVLLAGALGWSAATAKLLAGVPRGHLAEFTAIHPVTIFFVVDLGIALVGLADEPVQGIIAERVEMAPRIGDGLQAIDLVI